MSSPGGVFSVTFPGAIRHRRLPISRTGARSYAYVGVGYPGGTYVDVGVSYRAVSYPEVTYTYVDVTYHGVTYYPVTYYTVTYLGVTYCYVTVTYGYVGKGCH